MPWFKVDDKLHDHRKARTAGTAAMGLWVLAGSWSMDNLSDGFIPAAVCSRWDRNFKALAARLVDAGFWEPGELDREDGWWFHDWKSMQPSKDEVATKRGQISEARSRAGKIGAATRWADGKPDGNPDGNPDSKPGGKPVANEWQPDSKPGGKPVAPTRPEPIPEPIPEPEDLRTKDQLPSSTSSSEQDRHRFDEFWEIYPRKVGKRDAEKAYVRALKRCDSTAILAGARRLADDPNRELAYTAHPATWLNRDSWDDPPLPPRHSNGAQARDDRSAQTVLRMLNQANNHAIGDR